MGLLKTRMSGDEDWPHILAAGDDAAQRLPPLVRGAIVDVVELPKAAGFTFHTRTTWTEGRRGSFATTRPRDFTSVTTRDFHQHGFPMCARAEGGEASEGREEGGDAEDPRGGGEWETCKGEGWETCEEAELRISRPGRTCPGGFAFPTGCAKATSR